MRMGILALGVLVVLGGCGGSYDEASAGSGMTGWSTTGCEFARHTPDAAAKLGALIAGIESAGKGTYGDSYAGVEIDEERLRAIVYRVPSAGFDDWIRDAAEGQCVVVRDAGHTAAALAEWHDRVLADLPYWNGRGIHVDTIGARHDGGGVEIGTRDPETVQREMLTRYGKDAPLIFLPSEPMRTLPTDT